MFDLIKDNSFDIQKTKDYILSIQVSLDGFSFLLVQPQKNRIVAYKNSKVQISSSELLSRHLKEWLEAEKLLTNHFKKVRIFILTEKFALIPGNFFEQEKQRMISSTLFDKKIHNNYLESKIQNPDSNLIFPVSKDLIEVLQQFFGKRIEINHPIAKLTEFKPDSRLLYRSIILPGDKLFYLIIFKKDKIMSANCFHSEHQNDIVYNVLNTFNQLNITRNESELFLAGTSSQNTEVRSLLKTYFNHINNLKTAEIVSNSEIIYNSLPLYLTIN